MEVALAPVDEIPDGGIKKVDFFGREVLLTKTDGRPRAIMNCCMHLGGPLSRMERSAFAPGTKPNGNSVAARRSGGRGGPTLA